MNEKCVVAIGMSVPVDGVETSIVLAARSHFRHVPEHHLEYMD